MTMTTVEVVSRFYRLPERQRELLALRAIGWALGTQGNPVEEWLLEAESDASREALRV